MIEIQAPKELPPENKLSVFLGGTIDNGDSENWQKTIINSLKEEDGYILNPRKNDWDSTWKCDLSDKRFKEQVSWEWRAMHRATFIVFNFLPDSISPITLLELGGFLHKNPIVCCQPGYWRKGNVDFVCNYSYITVVETENELIKIIKQKIDETK